MTSKTLDASPRTPARSRRLGRTPVAVAALISISGVAWAEPSATVLFTSGEVHVIAANGQAKEARNGLIVDSGETIETGKGRIQLRMVDGAMMSLTERTVLRLDDYHLAGAAGDDERGYMSLVRGALRTISGSIGKARRDNYKLDTPSGTIGIRGTEYTVNVEDGLRVGVVNGRVAVCNDGGCIDVPKGSSAFTKNRSSRATVSPRVSVIVPPVGSGGERVAAADTNTAAQAAAATNVASTSEPEAFAPTGGERVARALYESFVAPVPSSASTPAVTTTGDGVLPTLTAAPAPGNANAPATATLSPGVVSVAPAPAATSADAGAVSSPAPAPAVSTAPAPVAAPTPAAPSPAAPSPSPSPTAAPSPAPAAPAPSPIAASPSPAPVAAPSPTGGGSSGVSTSGSPAASPAPVAAQQSVPLANGSGILGLVWRTDKDQPGSGLATGTITFDAAGGLKELDPAGKSDAILSKGTAIDPGSDGIVAWGRWVDGQSKVNDAYGEGKGNIAALHYFAFVASPTSPVLGTFASFASTAPTVTSSGTLVATGSINGASGSLNAVFLTVLGGTAAYSLNVPVDGQTFSLKGVAYQTSAFGFSGVSLITSTGQGCIGGCTGSLGGNVSVIGLIGGASGNRAGITYGFDSRIGNVSGVIVFKR